MISQECKYNEVNYRFPSISQPIQRFIQRLINRYKQWKLGRLHLDLLLTMEDRMRKDIGLSLTDADSLRTSCSFRVMFQQELNNISSFR